MRRTARRNIEEMGTNDEPTAAEPLPMESESPVEASREPADGGFFFDRIAAISDAEWESRFVAYLYQTAPKISLPGDKHYIAKLNSKFDESSVLANYGSGQYHVRLNDKTLRKTVSTHLFSVYDANKPPSVDAALIVDCPENAPFLKWKKSDATTAGSENGASAVVAEIARDAMRKPKTDVTEGMLLGMAEGRDKLAEKLASMTAQQPTADPIQALDRAADLIRKLTPNTPTAPTADPIQALDRAVALLQKLQPTPAATPIQKSPVDTVTEMVELMKSLQQLTPAPAVDSGGGTLAAVGVIVTALKDPLTLLTQVLLQKLQPAPQGTAAVPQQVQPQPEAPSTSTAQAQPPRLPESLVPLVTAISPLLLRWMQTEPDTTGEELGRDLAQHTYENYGLEDLNSLQQLGADSIVNLYRQSPYWLTIAPMATKFQRLVESFVVWEPPRDDGEEVEVID